jgi:glycerol-3-phosphate O-acyltransferase
MTLMRADAPIFSFNQQRSALIARAVERVMATTDDVLHILNDAAYHETRRLDGTRRTKDVDRLDTWRRLARRVGRMGQAERQSELRALTAHYVEDIAGHFDPRVYRFSTHLLPTLVTSLLSPRSLPRLIRHPQRLLSLDAIANKVVVGGDTKRLQKLSKSGTLVFVPTHSSNLDSIVFGFALERSNLPPATYGAGKNLFTNPLLSFFMENLGAYRVDRRLRHQLYKNCLKAYSTILLESGYHSLFFPGGTRSRSGCVESKLKLGLMGTGVEAYGRTLLAARERKVFFVPSTINYLLTLEAETLIADFLAAEGKARYIIEDDESTRAGRVASFTRKLLGMSGSVVIRFGDPLDPFGHQVDEEGESIDARGRRVDTSSYVRNLDGEVCIDRERDAQYTRELASAIADSFTRHTVLFSTHLVAGACFEWLHAEAGTDDLFTILRQRDCAIDRLKLARRTQALRDTMRERERAGEVFLSDRIRDVEGENIVDLAMRAFGGYHTHPVLEERGKKIALRDTKLLYYYQNRLVGHGCGFSTGAPR